MKYPRLTIFILSACAIAAFLGLRRVHFAEYVGDKPSERGIKTGWANEIPGHLEYAAGKLSLVADFSDKVDGAVKLYLINDTMEPIQLPSQDGDVGAKRIAKSPGGEWNRADIYQQSWCGNSYYPIPPIPARRYRAWYQKVDSADGEERPMKFRVVSPKYTLESNTGTGKVSATDISRCQVDSHALTTTASFEEVAAVATQKRPGADGAVSPLNNAISALGRFPNHPQLLQTIKDVIERLPDASEANDHLSNHSQCLVILSTMMKDNPLKTEAWSYVFSLLKNTNDPVNVATLGWIIRHQDTNSAKVENLIHSILQDQGHPLHEVLIRMMRPYIDGPEALSHLNSATLSMDEIRKVLKKVTEQKPQKPQKP